MRRLAITRRWLLGLSALLPFGRTRTVLGAMRDATGLDVPSALARLLPARVDAAIIGRAYLTSSPDDGDLATLVRQLLAMADNTGDLQTAIGNRLRKDFDEHQTVRVRGWVLSRTEARLCALSALLTDGHRAPDSRIA